MSLSYQLTTSPCRCQRLFIKALKKTSISNLHENSGTVEYFAGQSNFRLTGLQGKWLKKLSLSPELSLNLIQNQKRRIDSVQ